MDIAHKFCKHPDKSYKMQWIDKWYNGKDVPVGWLCPENITFISNILFPFACAIRRMTAGTGRRSIYAVFRHIYDRLKGNHGPAFGSCRPACKK
jgi:hypothetical protein